MNSDFGHGVEREAKRDIDSDWLPLLPLKTVLFPDGVLPLKIVDASCIDMVRDCMRRDAEFGVVLMKLGIEGDMTSEPEEIGCTAQITSWDMPQLGILKLKTRGARRFKVRNLRRLPGKQLQAQIDVIAPDIATVPLGAYAACADTLKIIIDDLARRQASGLEIIENSPFAEPIKLDDTGWVANRWSEILPIPLKARQKLLEVDDAQSRMDLVLYLLKKQAVL